MRDVVADYDLAERQGMARLPNRAIEAFQAAHFSSVGYPFRVKHASELSRYIDVMHEGRFEENLRLLKRVTPEELNLARLLANKTLAYSHLHFGRNFTGRHSITRALLQLRSLTIVGYNSSETKNILELGPGSGFLSLLMAMKGHVVSTIDVAQAFALHQSALFDHFFPDTSTQIPLRYSDLPDVTYRTRRIKQIPWWSYANLEDKQGRFDLVVANHVLSELHWDALHYTMEYFGRLHTSLHGSSPIIVAESLGAGFLPHQKVLRHFNQYGWSYELSSHFHIFRFNPSTAALQMDATRRREKLNLQKQKWGSLFLARALRKAKRLGSQEIDIEPNLEDVSIVKLRHVFDSLVPDERTPDEKFNLHIRMSSI